MNTYFKNVQTLDELRKQYKDLLKKYHPDNGGSEDITKAINVEYEKLFKILKDNHSRQSTADNKTSDKQSSKSLAHGCGSRAIPILTGKN